MKNDHNCLYVIWKDPQSRRNYTVGKITQNGKYYFEYCFDYKEAMKVGWELMKAFPTEKVYENETLFAAFAGRLPDPKRKGIESILKKYGLEEYNAFELLRKSSGRLPIDTYEFIDPIFPEDEIIEREFFLMGTRYYLGCKGKNCTNRLNLSEGEEVYFTCEPENVEDSNAVVVKNKKGDKIGYIPRYFSESITDKIKKGMTYSCIIIDLNIDAHCEDCIKVRLRIPRNIK